jgi:hypothetical protein
MLKCCEIVSGERFRASFLGFFFYTVVLLGLPVCLSAQNTDNAIYLRAYEQPGVFADSFPIHTPVHFEWMAQVDFQPESMMFWCEKESEPLLAPFPQQFRQGKIPPCSYGAPGIYQSRYCVRKGVESPICGSKQITVFHPMDTVKAPQKEYKNLSAIVGQSVTLRVSVPDSLKQVYKIKQVSQIGTEGIPDSGSASPADSIPLIEKDFLKKEKEGSAVVPPKTARLRINRFWDLGDDGTFDVVSPHFDSLVIVPQKAGEIKVRIGYWVGAQGEGTQSEQLLKIEVMP